MIAVEVVEGVGHTVQARAGVGQHRLRGLEALAGGQTPGEVPGMDADHRPELLLLAHLHLGQEVAGVDQVHGVNLPLILGGGMLRQGQEGVLLGGGDALNHLTRGPWKDKPRPSLVNNWEATYFKFDTEKLLDIARTAAGRGIEMLVLDDGWFGCRDTDTPMLAEERTLRSWS